MYRLIRRGKSVKDKNNVRTMYLKQKREAWKSTRDVKLFRNRILRRGEKEKKMSKKTRSKCNEGNLPAGNKVWKKKKII